VHAIPVPNRDAPQDVDTEADFAALLLDWSSTGAPDVPRYCQRCAAEVGLRQVHARLRPVCPACGFTYFFDPKVATAVVVEIDGRVVLQRRAIDPGMGKWTFPGGFVDRGESVLEAAAREVQEEVGLAVTDLRLLDAYAEPGETVILIAYHTNVTGQHPIVGDESTDVRLFLPNALPDLAFPRNALVIADWLRLTRDQSLGETRT
jgi:ADP-ribose pyrophosphatase YjhB (NUDIX family)